jgi:hypothetical protein
MIFAVYELLQSIKNNEKNSKDITNSIYGKVKEEARIVGWKNKRSSEKKMSIAIYDILSENGYPKDKTNELSKYIQSLSKKTSLEVVATSIYNLFRELFHSLFLYFFDQVSLSYTTTKRNKALKK